MVSEVQIAEFDGDLKIHLFPQDTNQILVRLENLADLFDGTPSETSMEIKKESKRAGTCALGDQVRCNGFQFIEQQTF